MRAIRLLAARVPAEQRRRGSSAATSAVEEARAVEMVRDRPVVIARRGGAQAEHAGDRAEGGKTGKQAAAGEEGHGLIVDQAPRTSGTPSARAAVTSSLSSVASGNAFALGKLKIDGVVEGQTIVPRARTSISANVVAASAGSSSGELQIERREARSLLCRRSPRPLSEQHRCSEFRTTRCSRRREIVFVDHEPESQVQRGVIISSGKNQQP